MDPRTAAPTSPDPDAVEFVRFCYRRRRVGWPELYDEMCAVANRGLFRGYGSDDLAAHGVAFGLFDMPRLAALAASVVEQEKAARRAVQVTIRAAEPDVEVVAVAAATPVAEVVDVVAAATPVTDVVLPNPAPASPPATHPEPDRVPLDIRESRSRSDAPGGPSFVRLAVPAGA